MPKFQDATDTDLIMSDKILIGKKGWIWWISTSIVGCVWAMGITVLIFDTFHNNYVRPWYEILGTVGLSIVSSAMLIWCFTHRTEIGRDGVVSKDLWLTRKIYWYEVMAIYAPDGQSLWVVAPKNNRKIKKITVWAGFYVNGDTLARGVLARQYLAQPIVFVSANLEKSYGFPPVGVPVIENISKNIAST